MNPYALGLSPCPNDTFIFHALLNRLVPLDIAVDAHFADVEQLNRLALMGSLPITKVSAGVLPAILDKYAILDSGSALGWGVGPLIVAKNDDFDPATARIAIPGSHTTANLLLDRCGKFAGPRIEMVFSEIIPAVSMGEAELGVIIHEGRFTYGQMGLKRILDLGVWWEETRRLPLPLGVIVIRRDVATPVARALERAIAESVAYAWKNPETSKTFIREHAQEMSDTITQAHINTFVTSFSHSLGTEGRKAVCRLLGMEGASASQCDALFL